MVRIVASWVVSLLGVGTVAVGVAAAEDKAPVDPKDVPLRLTLTAKTTQYTLDTGGLSAEEYKKQVSMTEGRPAPTPAVDLAVVITNTSDKPVSVWVNGDPVILTLDLKGKGAVNVQPLLAFTQEFRAPQAVEIAPGKSHTIPVKSLTSGFRMASVYSYWTEPGTYELVATLKTGVRPIPKGAPEFDDYGVVTLTSPPLKLTVMARK